MEDIPLDLIIIPVPRQSLQLDWSRKQRSDLLSHRNCIDSSGELTTRFVRRDREQKQCYLCCSATSLTIAVHSHIPLGTVLFTPPVFPEQRHLLGSLPSLRMESRRLVGLHTARCTWWPSHMSWRSLEWQWPSDGTSCPGPPEAMAACLWGMETNHCCLEVRMGGRAWVKTDIALCRSLIPTHTYSITFYSAF